MSGLSTSVRAIAASVDFTCAITATGVKCWGDNASQQLGDGTTTQRLTPVPVSGLAGTPDMLAAGGAHACMLNSVGALKCWGVGAFGQLGNGLIVATSAPVSPTGYSSGGGFAIAAGSEHTCMVDSMAALRCWGRNQNGQLGDGSLNLADAPNDVTDFAAGTMLIQYSAKLSVSSFSVGAHGIDAHYDGDPAFDPSDAPQLGQTVAVGNTTTSVGPVPSAPKVGQSVTFHIVVARVLPAAGTPSGTVTIDYGDGSAAADATLSGGAANPTHSYAAAGNYNVNVGYAGDGNFAASTSPSLVQTVNKGSTTTTLIVTPASTTPGQQVTLSAMVAVVAPAAGPRTGSVTFKDGSVPLGTVSLSGNGASLQTSSLAIGSRSLTASYSGDSNFSASTSAAKIETVSPMVAAEFKVNGSAGGGSANRQAPAIARLSDGSTVVVWEAAVQDGSGIGVYGQRFRASGAPLGSEFRVNTTTTNDQKQPAVAGLTGGGFVTVWTSAQTASAGLDIYAQRYTTAGAKLGTEFKVNTTTTADQSMPAVAGLPDGGFVTVWTSAQTASAGLDIYAQRYNATGVKQGAEFRVNTTTAADQTQPAVAALATGFVVAWASKQIAAMGFDIYGQRYNGLGAKLGSEFRINTTQASDQTQPQLAKLNDGSFVAVWTSNLQDTSGLGVYAQRYSAAGSKRGSEFRVNTTVGRDQSQPSVAAFTDNGFIVVWTSNLQDGSGLGVYGQAFTTAGVKANVEFRLATTTTGNQSQPHAAAFATGACTAVWTSSAVTPQAIFGQRLKLGGL